MIHIITPSPPGTQVCVLKLIMMWEKWVCTNRAVDTATTGPDKSDVQMPDKHLPSQFCMQGR